MSLLSSIFTNITKNSNIVRPIKEALKLGDERVKKGLTSNLKQAPKKTEEITESIFTIPRDDAKKITGVTLGTLAGTKAYIDETRGEPTGFASNYNGPVIKAYKPNLKDEVRTYARRLKEGKLNDLERQDLVIELIATFIPGPKAASAAKAIATKIPKGSMNNVAKYLEGQIVTLRDKLVRQNPKAMEAIKAGAAKLEQQISGAIKDRLSKVDLTGKPDTIIKNIQATAKGLGELAKKANVTNKEELKNLIKFTKDLGKVISNSPVYTKAKSLTLGEGVKRGSAVDIATNLGIVGLDVFDLYQAWKENDGSFLPKLLPNAARSAFMFSKLDPIRRILFSSLGYMGTNSLQKAAWSKLNKDLGNEFEVDEEFEQDVKAGLSKLGLENELPEYFTGASGRKYHVKNNKVYAYDTGRPVNVEQAIADFQNQRQTLQQNAVDRINNIDSQLADIDTAIANGYQVPEDMITNLINQRGQAVNELDIITNDGYEPEQVEYDADGDLAEQYYQKVLQPEEQKQQRAAAMQQFDYNAAYENNFNNLAERIYGDVAQYYSPEALDVEYRKYRAQSINPTAGANWMPNLSREEFAQYQQMQKMRELAPQIRQQAELLTKEDYSRWDATRKHALEVEKNLGTQIKNYYDILDKAQNTQANIQEKIFNQGHKTRELALKNKEYGLKEYDSAIKAQNAATAAGQLELNRAEAERRRQLIPYQQFGYVASGLEGLGYTGQSIEDVYKQNPELVQQIMPGYQPPQQQEEQPKRKGIFGW